MRRSRPLYGITVRHPVYAWPEGAPRAYAWVLPCNPEVLNFVTLDPADEDRPAVQAQRRAIFDFLQSGEPYGAHPVAWVIAESDDLAFLWDRLTEFSDEARPDICAGRMVPLRGPLKLPPTQWGRIDFAVHGNELNDQWAHEPVSLSCDGNCTRFVFDHGHADSITELNGWPVPELKLPVDPEADPDSHPVERLCALLRKQPAAAADGQPIPLASVDGPARYPDPDDPQNPDAYSMTHMKYWSRRQKGRRSSLYKDSDWLPMPYWFEERKRRSKRSDDCEEEDVF
jgi:hypothetical protein